jgi:hypothetical protein
VPPLSSLSSPAYVAWWAGTTTRFLAPIDCSKFQSTREGEKSRKKRKDRIGKEAVGRGEVRRGRKAHKKIRRKEGRRR